MDRHRNAKLEVNRLTQEANDDLPAGIAGFEDAKKVWSSSRVFSPLAD